MQGSGLYRKRGPLRPKLRFYGFRRNRFNYPPCYGQQTRHFVLDMFPNLDLTLLINVASPEFIEPLMKFQAIRVTQILVIKKVFDRP